MLYKGFHGTPGGTRTPNLLIRSHTDSVPAGTTQFRRVLSCKGLDGSSSHLVPANVAQYHGIGLQLGCNPAAHLPASVLNWFFAPSIRVMASRAPHPIGGSHHLVEIPLAGDAL